MITPKFVVFDWDGTAVATRAPDAAAHLLGPLERVLESGIGAYVVTGTKHDWAATQLRDLRADLAARITVCCNRGSEVYQLTNPPTLLYRREMTTVERAAMDHVGSAVTGPLIAAGHDVRIISDRLNRIKIDLVPDWNDPPKHQIDEVVAIVNERFVDHGSLAQLLQNAAELAASTTADLRVTSDAKHIEIGITDKSHSMDWVMADITARGGSIAEVMIIGDEFGSMGGSEGSDAKTALAGASVFSVGLEPNGVPDGVEHLGGGPMRFAKILETIA